MFSSGDVQGVVGGEVPPHTAHLDAPEVPACRWRRVGERVHVPLEQLDRALLREAGNGTPGRSQSVRFIINRARIRLSVTGHTFIEIPPYGRSHGHHGRTVSALPPRSSNGNGAPPQMANAFELSIRDVLVMFR